MQFSIISAAIFVLAATTQALPHPSPHDYTQGHGSNQPSRWGPGPGRGGHFRPPKGSLEGFGGNNIGDIDINKVDINELLEIIGDVDVSDGDFQDLVKLNTLTRLAVQKLLAGEQVQKQPDNSDGAAGSDGDSDGEVSSGGDNDDDSDGEDDAGAGGEDQQAPPNETVENKPVPDPSETGNKSKPTPDTTETGDKVEPTPGGQETTPDGSEVVDKPTNDETETGQQLVPDQSETGGQQPAADDHAGSPSDQQQEQEQAGDVARRWNPWKALKKGAKKVVNKGKKTAKKVVNKGKSAAKKVINKLNPFN